MILLRYTLLVSTDVVPREFLRCGGIFSFKLKCAMLPRESKLPIPHCERKSIFLKCDKLKKGAFKKTGCSSRNLQWSFDLKSILCEKFVNTSLLEKQPHSIFIASSLLLC